MSGRIRINCVGRIDGHTGIGRITRAFLEAWKDHFDVTFIDTRPESSDMSLLPAGVLASRPGDPHLDTADLSVFTDVTCNDRDDKNWTKVPPTRLKYIYSVFDSTRAPIEWADIINNHFDAVLVPAQFLINTFRASGVQKPIFLLPLAIDLSPVLRLPAPLPPHGRPFRFGFIGSREARKNVDALVDCFVQVFRNEPDVELHVHCALDFHGDPKYFDLLRSRHAGIRVSTGKLELSDYLELIKRLDCFVSLSMGESYSVVPREFLAAGKPVILSNCFAHAEILSGLGGEMADLGFCVDADVPVPAYYGHIFGGRTYGLQYDTYKPSACAALEQVFSHRESLFSADLVNGRRVWARQFDHSALGDLYRSLVTPSMSRRATGDVLEHGGISTRDSNLLSRLVGRNLALSLTEEIRDRPVKYVVIANDGGFFSVFNRMMSYLTWASSEHPDSVVLPDWRIAAMQRHWKAERFTSFCYGTERDGNLWLKLFEPLPYADYDDASYDNDEILYRDALIKDDFNEHDEPWLTYVHAYKLYKSPGFRRWRQWYHLHLCSHVRLREHLRERIEGFFDRNLRGFKVVSAHIRHPSHGIEQPGARMPTVDLYCEKIRGLMEVHGLNPRSTRIFLATDQDSVVDEMVAAFGDLIVVSPSVTRTTRDLDDKFKQLPPRSRMREGHQIQHLTAADPSKWSIQMAEEVIVDAYLLARGDFFVHVTSNIATAVSFINPRIRMIYCE